MFSIAIIAWIALCMMSLLTIAQACYFLVYRSVVGRNGVCAEPENWQPAVCVMLCVRGADPSLPRCLAALDRLQWPEYQVLVGLDSEQDAAIAFVREYTNRKDGKFQLHLLGGISSDCSLKCAMLIEMIQSVDSRFEVIAFVDADSVVDEMWLHQLVLPLSSSDVGVVSGTRWFAAASTPSGNAGSVVRAIWNVAAVVQMRLFQIVWGGSMAMRSSTIKRLQLTELWKSQFCEDTCLSDLMRCNGLKVIRPQKLLVVNDESIALGRTAAWIHRQLLTVRLYNSKWPLVAIHGLAVGAVLVVSITSLLISLFGAYWQSAIWIVLSYGLYTFLSWLMLEMVVRLNHGYQDPGSGLVSSISRFLPAVFLLPVTQIVHFMATVRTLFTTKISWRAIDYEIKGKKIRMLGYKPFLFTRDSGDSVH